MNTAITHKHTTSTSTATTMSENEKNVRKEKKIKTAIIKKNTRSKRKKNDNDKEHFCRAKTMNEMRTMRDGILRLKQFKNAKSQYNDNNRTKWMNVHIFMDIL